MNMTKYDFEIVTESSANIPEELTRELGIRILPYYFTINGEEHPCYREGMPFREIAAPFYDAMRAGLEPSTSLINSTRFCDELIPYLEAGKDVVLLIIASGISGTFDQALAAQKMLAEKFPARKVYVLDSGNASLGEGLQAIEAAKMREQGATAEECAAWIRENYYRFNSYVTVEDLKYLHRTGRISKVTAVAGTLLGIKPLIRADGVGLPKMEVYGKVRGRKKALAAIVEAYDKLADHSGKYPIAIAHADALAEANELAETLRQHGATDIIMEYYDLCTGSHIGPGTIALFFYGVDRREQAEKEREEKEEHSLLGKIFKKS